MTAADGQKREPGDTTHEHRAPETAEALVRRILETRVQSRRGWLYWTWVGLALFLFWFAFTTGWPLAPWWTWLLPIGVSLTARGIGRLAAAAETASVAAVLQGDDCQRAGVLIELLTWPVKRVQAVARWRLMSLLSTLQEDDAAALTPVQLACLYDHLTPMQAARDPDFVEAILRALPRIGDDRAIPAVMRLVRMRAWTRSLCRIRTTARVLLPAIEARVLRVRRERGLVEDDARAGVGTVESPPGRRGFGEELGLRPQMRLGFLVAAWLTIVPLGAWLSFDLAKQHRWLEALLYGALAVGATQLHRLTLMQRHARLLRSIMQEEDVEAVGRIAEAVLWPDEKIRAAAMSALVRVLPKLKASDAGILTSTQRTCLNGLLDRTTARERPDVVVALLRALEQVGDMSAVPYVRSLANMPDATARMATVREAARECLPVLLERARQNTDPQVLLRPAEQPAAPEEMLVRPVMPGPVAEDAMLLRPADTVDEATV